MTEIDPPLSCWTINGDLIAIFAQLNDQQYLANDEQGDWLIVQRDDLNDPIKELDVKGYDPELDD